MKQLLLIATIFICACSHSSPQADSLKPPSSYQVINLGPQFEHFWKLAANQPFETQLRLWNEIIEKPYQAFYDEMVWQKKDNLKWEERKTRRLKEMFSKYPALYPKIIENFRSFDGTLALQIGKFKSSFSDAHFSLPIYAAPTTTFNGKGGEGGDSGDALGKTVLAFGLDMVVEYKNDPDVLYSHELFHIYHTDAIGVNEHVFLEQGHLTLPLWLEGLATYVSLQMNPSASLSTALMDKDLPNVTDTQIKTLAGKFLREADEKAFDPKKPGIYKKWFAIDPQYSLGKGFPQRCGYLLGLRVAQELSRNHSLSEMVHWKVADIHRNVLDAIKRISVASTKNSLKPATVSESTISESSNTTCIGSPTAKHFAVYLHGIDSMSPSDQEKANRKVLESIAKDLDIRFALPRAQDKCGDSLCWGWALTDEKAKQSLPVIEAAAQACFPQGKSYGLLGFSSGGYLAEKIFRACFIPKSLPKVKWIVASGATMMKGPIEPDPKDLSECSQLSMLVGTKDKFNYDPSKNYLNQLKKKQAKVEYFEFEGNHSLFEEPIKRVLGKYVSTE